MANTKTEYRDIDWALIGLDYFLQRAETGDTGSKAKLAFDRYMYDRLDEHLPREDFSRVIGIVNRIARLLPREELFGTVSWTDDDIEEAFDFLEIECTPERIAAVRDRALRRDRIRDAQIDAGWAVIRGCIDELYGEEA